MLYSGWGGIGQIISQNDSDKIKKNNLDDLTVYYRANTLLDNSWFHLRCRSLGREREVEKATCQIKVLGFEVFSLLE